MIVMAAYRRRSRVQPSMQIPMAMVLETRIPVFRLVKPQAGFVADNTDCDDTNPDINPGEEEIPNNGIDEDCNGSDEVIDADGDGFNSDEDCNDNNPDINPEAEEVCDGVDNNCDGNIDEGVETLFYADMDGDGYGNPEVSILACEAPIGFVADNTDCDDVNPTANPGAIEVCDGDDNDCDGEIDEGLETIYYADMDGDGYGNPEVTIMACKAPGGFVADNTDCDDSNPDINPGATEICDGVDNNCDGNIDEGVESIFYADTDGDGFGDPDSSTSACEAPSGYVADNTDCDDTNPDVNPGAEEVCDGLDNNCDGNIDEGVESVFYADTDGDGFGDPDSGTSACEAPSGYVADNTDCDDTNSDVNPGAEEVCDGVDNNCDGNIDEGLLSTFYADTDGDGFGDPNSSTSACDVPNGFVSDNTDCDDTNPDVNPGVEEVCDGIDNNCDGNIDEGVESIFYADTDGDGFGDPNSSTSACEAPNGFVSDNTDCDDTDPDVNPGAEEVCDGVDNNCDGNIDEGVESIFYADTDGDGFGNPDSSISACEAPNGYVADNTDCDDTNPDINPGEVEIPNNGIDEDCNGADEVIDADGDGYNSDEDCNDTNPDINPGALEVCDGVDNNCDGNIDEGLLSTFYADTDGDGFGDPDSSISACEAPNGYVTDNTDCDDTNPDVNPGAEEVCDGVDNNCDGNIDEGVESIFYADTDGDGFGNPDSSISACEAPNGLCRQTTRTATIPIRM